MTPDQQLARMILFNVFYGQFKPFRKKLFTTAGNLIDGDHPFGTEQEGIFDRELTHRRAAQTATVSAGSMSQFSAAMYRSRPTRLFRDCRPTYANLESWDFFRFCPFGILLCSMEFFEDLRGQWILDCWFADTLFGSAWHCLDAFS